MINDTGRQHMETKVEKPKGQTSEKPVESLQVQISEMEHELILQNFADLKRRGDGELRIACRREPRSGVVEITYVGVHEKADLEGLRKMYRQLQVKGTRF
jgi:hypothetical protein